MNLELSDDHARLDLDRITGWLATSYWSPGVRREVVERAAAGSEVVGAYDATGQVGYCRLVTDRATYAWLADVWVAEAARGRGIGRRLVERALERCAGWQVRRVMLATKDAHGLYASYGFTPLPDGRFLELRSSPGSRPTPVLGRTSVGRSAAVDGCRVTHELPRKAWHNPPDPLPGQPPPRVRPGCFRHR